MPSTPRPFSLSRFIAALATSLFLFLVFGVLFWAMFSKREVEGFPSDGAVLTPAGVDRIDAAFEAEWRQAGVTPTPGADFHTLARRLYLALTGAVPSLSEIRQLEATDPERRLDALLDHLFSDQRYHAYVAERLARIYVGVEPGPFLVYRRRRMVNWIRDQLAMNRPYDAMSRDLIASRGIWTTSPQANFITVSVMQGQKGGPDEVKLAARTSRAFLGVSLDCMQCHDDKFGDRWKQKDFHQLAAFFAQSEVGLGGVWDNPKVDYKTRLRGQREAAPVSMEVPFQKEILPPGGTPRERLAGWITHAENASFSRAVANRAWGLLFGKPLVSPIDDIPIEGPVPPALDILARQFVETDHDLRALIRCIAHTAPFRRASRSADPAEPVTGEQEAAWAAFPITLLRPEQVAGSVIQSATIHPLNSSSHIVKRLQRLAETNDFVKRYGDSGEDEFSERIGTIPQRLLLMNGKLVDERTRPNPVTNATTRIATLAKDPGKAVDSAFLAVLVRRPTPGEREYFVDQIRDTQGDRRQEGVHDLYWALMNSTEFSWNR